MHHSYTDLGKTVSWDDIKRYHTSYRYNDTIITPKRAKELQAQGKKVVEPWSDIGYHMGVEEVIMPNPWYGNPVFIQFGRPIDKAGAHAVDFNSVGYGVCIIGNFDQAAPDEIQWQAALSLVRGLMVRDEIPVENVLGHWETFIRRKQAKDQKAAQKIKSCPGLKFDMVQFRKDLGIWKV